MSLKRALYLIAVSTLLSTIAIAGDAYRSSSFSLQGAGSGRQIIAAAEFNLNAKASASFEGTWMRRGNDLSEREAEETGDTLDSQGREFALLFSRYTNPINMSGFHWTLGAGYRTVDVHWYRKPQAHEDLSLLRLDDSGRTSQDFQLRGLTYHGRLGYRFVGDSYPVVIGIYLGIRHYQAQVDDADIGNSENHRNHTDDSVRKSLQHRYMTSTVPGIYFGLAL